MKNVLLILFILMSTLTYAQNIKLNLLTSGHYIESEYTYAQGTPIESETEMPLGFSIALQTEFSLGKQMSFYSGLSYQKNNFHPNLALGSVYGVLVDPTGQLNDLNAPFLKDHRFHLLSIPIGLKVHPWQFKSIQPYFAFGFDTNFRISETEEYQDILLGKDQESVVIAENGLKYFGTNFNIGLGLNISIAKHWNLLFHHQLSIWEYRAGNEKFKKNGEMLFTKSLMKMSQISMGFGIQYVL